MAEITTTWDYDSVYAALNAAYESFPVDLTTILDISINAPTLLHQKHTVNKLILALLNETDLRISDRVSN